MSAVYERTTATPRRPADRTNAPIAPATTNTYFRSNRSALMIVLDSFPTPRQLNSSLNEIRAKAAYPEGTGATSKVEDAVRLIDSTAKLRVAYAGPIRNLASPIRSQH